MSVVVLGSINLDLVCRLAALPRRGETVMAAGLERFAGGKGANQAVAAARWGATTRLLGAVGDDEAGRFLLERLEEAGVNVGQVARREGEPTGQALILLSEAGENMIAVVGGANQTVGPVHVARADLAGAKVVLAQLETPVGAIGELFAAAEPIRILNAAPALPEGRELFPLCDWLVVNEAELGAYAPGRETKDAAESLISRPGQRVVVTLGARGAMAVGEAGVVRVDGLPARVVDTTGAGDCFCGVLAASLAEGVDVAAALAAANAAAACSTESVGAHAPADLRARVEAG